MLNPFQKLFLLFSLCSSLAIYAMQTSNDNNDNNQRPLYNQEANSELLQIINTLYEEQLTIKQSWKNIIKCLESGADPNLQGKDGISLLALSSSKKTKEYFYYFLKLGANPNICDDIGYTPLHALLAQLINNSQNFDSEMLETLLQHNANPNLPVIEKIPNTQESYSFLPLNSAIIRGCENSVKILLKYNANINAKSSYIRSQPFFHCSITPLARAMIHNKLGILEVLCREYASLENVSNFHGTAFDFAFALKNPELPIKTLIVNARFKLPTTKKKLDLTALTLLLILKNQLKFQIPEDLKLHILSMLPAEQNYAEPDSKLYQGLLHKNYKNPYLFARLLHHVESILQILNKKNKLGITASSLLTQDDRTKKIIPQLTKDINIVLQSKYKEILPNNLALQIYNNYEKLLEEEQLKIQSST